MNLLPIDNNCLEDSMTLKVTRTSDNQVFRFTFSVIEADKWSFVTSSSYRVILTVFRMRTVIVLRKNRHLSPEPDPIIKR